MTSPLTQSPRAEQGPGETNIVKVVFASLIGIGWLHLFDGAYKPLLYASVLTGPANAVQWSLPRC